MAAPNRLREDFDGPSPCGLAKRARDAGQLRRLLALAKIYDGGPSVAPGGVDRTISAPARPIFSAPSVPRTARA